MPLRIGFDLDGTVADMYSALHEEAIKLFGEDVLAKPVVKKTPATDNADGVIAPEPEDSTGSLAMEELHLTARQQMQLWDHVKKIENFWTKLPELEPGIIARIAKAAAERQWEIIFLTTRPSTAGELTQLQSQRWLDAHGFRYPSVMVVQRSRGKIADALHLDAFVDDRPENCLDIAVESKAKVILVWHGDLKDVPPGAKRLGVRPVSTISEALALLEQLDDVRKKPGIVQSIKRAFSRGTEDL
jgi:uncharacterized HAD superfamily protein